ncbi:MAG TPA: site-specific DNA-methyltransferase [Acidobacteria bacterium]|nr:site-specific DNA-methyltransferase [Acidobacteriota bacterium]
MAKRSRKKTTGPKPVEALAHTDTRVNIPTDELADFVASEEKKPSTLRYPRDPSLDPQLVWQGKDEQDGEDLVVQAPPIYIQEKIEPRAIVEDLRRRTAEADDELRLFSDFNGLEFDQLVDFYQHDVNWSNRLILGDSLQVMASLAEKENLRGQVQMIYIDPPYGIKFGSNWQVSTRKRDVRDGKDTDLTRQPEQIRAFRDTWEKGIHSYLSYLRDRLTVARDLLTESGSIFVQIGDENVHLVRSLLDEVFGRENHVADIAFRKTASATAETLPTIYDSLIWYARNREEIKYRQLFRPKSLGGEGATGYTHVELEDGSTRRLTQEEAAGLRELPSGAKAYGDHSLSSQRPPGDFPVELEGRTYRPSSGYWKTSQEGMARLIAAGRVVRSGRGLAYRRYLADFPAFPLANMWLDTMGQNQFGGPKRFVVQTALRVVERCVLMSTDPGDLVLDPTCGSGTTAYVAEQWGRRWITIDTSRVALALTRTRLMSARFPYYLLADSEEGRQKEAELTGVPASDGPVGHDVKKGFVYKRVPHITLKSIANNPDIREGMTREEIDEAIRRHADQELLYDQPYEDKKRVRVTGRFTVESLSPHRILDPDEERPESELTADKETGADGFVDMIIANLRKAGVQNTRRDERIVFDTLEPYAGAWIQAVGEFTGKHGETKRVAVSIGPEHGTVGPTQVKEAAKEAVKGVGFDLLVVCGFAFDARVGETAKEFGDLVVLPTKMNPDLVMGGDLLKKTGAGNLFMVFGEPDVNIKEEDDQIVVELRGVDVYDPTTGEIRSSSTDDIACWFIDTNYNEESFFVRHAYFTGGDKPYEKLKKTLRADIDEEAWATLYSTVSRPFPKPETGKIAVKVINHYGDEVLKVYEVG